MGRESTSPYTQSSRLTSYFQTSPPWTYVAVFLPKLLLGALPLAFVGLASDRRIRTMLLPAGVFVTFISLLGHKEWRFIVYLVPLFNIAAARGSRYLYALFSCILASLRG